MDLGLGGELDESDQTHEILQGFIKYCIIKIIFLKYKGLHLHFLTGNDTIFALCFGFS